MIFDMTKRVGGGSGLSLLGSGSVTLESDAPQVWKIPVTYSGTPVFAAVIRETELTDIGHALGAVNWFTSPQSDVDSVFDEGVWNVRFKSAANAYGNMGNSGGLRLQLSATEISLVRPAIAYPYKAGKYNWYIYGIPT